MQTGLFHETDAVAAEFFEAILWELTPYLQLLIQIVIQRSLSECQI